MISGTVIFISAAILSFVLTPVARAFAVRIGAIDIPQGRRIHTVPTPRLGGIAVLLAMLLSLGLAWTLDPFIRHVVARNAWHLVPLGVAVSGVTIVGVIDDVCSVRATAKLLVQIGAAGLVVLAGYRIRSFFGIEIGWLSGAATVLWIVAVTNAINMVDGLDGLAAGLGLIISASLFSISLFLASLTAAAILAALCGALLGFLFYNFHPARIFLGDSGSLLLGFLLAVTAVQSSNKAAEGASILFPLLSLGLPLAEVVLTTLRRTLRAIRVVRLDASTQRYEFSFFGGPTLFTADREHIHHRLMAMGVSYRNVVFALYGVCAALCACAFLIVAYRVTNLGLLLLAFAVVAVAARRLGYRELQLLNNGLFLPLFDLPMMNARFIIVLFDLIFTITSYLGAWLICSGARPSREAMLPLLSTLPPLATAQIVVFTLSGLYRHSYRYVGIADLLAIARAVALAIVVGAFALTLAHHWERPALSVLVLDGYLLGTLVLGSRLSFTYLDYLFNANRSGTQRTLIYGAGKGGIAALRELWGNPSLGMKPMAFLDDDPRKRGQIIHGIRVHGPEDLGSLVNERRLDALVVATCKIPKERLKRVVQRCALAGISVRVFRIGLDEVQREPDAVLQTVAADGSQM